MLLLLSPAALASGVPTTPPPVELKLPAPFVYEKTVGAEREVVFRHETHVALADRKCTGCHPRPFRMLSAEHATSHAAMKAGHACGACHDGRKAFGIADSTACATCHTGRPRPGMMSAAKAGTPAAPGLPRPIAYKRGDASPGRVTFHHETHAKGGCAGCHPRPFAMKSAGAKPGGAMHEAGACGRCHDGAKAFGVEDAASCARCHVEGKS
jgi:c(7)-type cytochrome triheme protein